MKISRILLTLSLVVGFCTSHGQDYNPPFLPVIGGLKPPKFSVSDPSEQTAGKNISLRYSRAYTQIYPFLMDAGKVNAETLPEGTLLFSRIASTPDGKVTLAPVLSKVRFDHEKYQLQMELNPKAEFYRWNDSKQELERTPMKAEDLAYSLQSFLKEYDAWGYSQYFEGIESIEVGKGDYEVIMHFNITDPLKYTRMGALMLGAQIIKKGYEFPGEGKLKEPEIPWSSGPYFIKPSSIDSSGKRVVYHRVNNHWVDQIYPDFPFYNFNSIEYILIADETGVDLALSSGDINIATFDALGEAENALAILSAEKRKKFSITPVPTVYTDQIWLNFNLQKMKNEKARKAIGMVFRDYELLNGHKTVVGSYYPLNATVVESSLFGNQNELSSVEMNQLASVLESNIPTEDLEILNSPESSILPEINSNRERRRVVREAIYLLEESGYRVNESGKMVDVKTGTPLKIHAITRDHDWALNLIRGNLKRLGVQIEVVKAETGSFRTLLENGDFDIVVGSKLGLEVPQAPYLHGLYNSTSVFRNNMGIKDPLLDEVTSSLFEAKDLADFSPLIKSQTKLVLAKSYAIPLLEKASRWVVHPSDIKPNILIGGKPDSMISFTWK